MAWRACLALALCTTPITCAGCEGFVDLIFSLLRTSSPPMYIGYSRPNSDATFFSAVSIAALFSGLEKFTNGSLVNSGLCSLTSAVAMMTSSSLLQLIILSRLRGQFRGGLVQFWLRYQQEPGLKEIQAHRERRI